MRTAPSDRRITQALRWMVGIFSSVSAPYQLVGGCAARAYGATRPVHDIDVYVPGRLHRLLRRWAVTLRSLPSGMPVRSGG